MRSITGLAVLALLATTAPVRADDRAQAVLEGELAAGGGADREIAARDSAGFAVGNAHLAARWTRPAPALDRRGLHICPSGTSGCFWIWTSLEPELVEEVGVDATASALYGADDLRSLQLEARAWGTVAGWRLEGRTAFQPDTSLRDRFWRSSRDVLQNNLVVAIPAMWSLGTPAVQVSFAPIDLDLGSRSELTPEGWTDLGFDNDLAIEFARVYSEHVTVDVATMHLVELGAADQRIGDTTYGTKVEAFDADLLALDVRAGAFAVAGRVGFADRGPLAPYEASGGSSHTSGPLHVATTYWAEARFGDVAARDPGLAVVVGGGSWLRLDPTGHAVDAGRLGSTTIAARGPRWSARGKLELGRLRRVLVGALAPATVDSVGSRYFMARGTLQASLQLARTLAVTGTTWVERSDRDDPRWQSPAPGTLATHAGADLVAVWSFRGPRPPR